MPPPSTEIALARPVDLPAAARLLEAAGLPADGLDSEHLLLLVARRGRHLLGCLALQVQGDAILVRAAAVEEAVRHQGIGGRLLDEALRLGTEAGLRLAVLRAPGSGELFALRGFRPVASGCLPAALQGEGTRPRPDPGEARAMLRELQPGVRVRAAVEADMPAVLAIYNHEVLHSSSTYQYTLRTLEEQGELLRLRQREGHGFFVAETATGHVVGYSSYGPFRPREGWRFSCEHAVYLHPQWRRRGIGKLLLPPVMAHARKQGFHTMVGVVDAGNTASLRLHEALGFRVAGILQEGGRKFERWLDVAFLQAML